MRKGILIAGIVALVAGIALYAVFPMLFSAGIGGLMSEGDPSLLIGSVVFASYQVPLSWALIIIGIILICAGAIMKNKTVAVGQVKHTRRHRKIQW
jgi:hypothetical protein